MDAEENQKQVSLRAHSPWKSLRDSHIPTAATKPWKSGKPKPGFPLSHSTSSLSQIQPKGGLAAVRSAPASRLILYDKYILSPGSFLDENMLPRCQRAYFVAGITPTLLALAAR